MITTVVIAAAGRGTRMKRLTDHKPKHLIPVLGKPLLLYLLTSLHSIGVKRFIIVVGYHAELMRDFFATLPYEVVEVHQNKVAPGRHGTAAVVAAALPETLGQSFVFINGDSLYSVDVLQRALVDDGYCHVFGTYHNDPSQYGVIDATADGVLRRIVEKPKEPLCNVVNLGIYTFQPNIATVLSRVPLSSRGEYEIVDAVNMLATHSTVRVEQVQSGWVELGRPQDIPVVERFILDYHLNV